MGATVGATIAPAATRVKANPAVVQGRAVMSMSPLIGPHEQLDIN
jgi:hypothetical protein